MSNINEKFIEEYIRQVIPPTPDYLEDIEEYAQKHHVPIIHSEVGQLLRVLIMISNPKKILEIGTAIGYSSILMAKAMDGDGKVLSIERRDDMIELANKNIKKANLSDRIKVLKGDAEKVLPTIEEEFDMVFLDGAKSKYMDFLPYCIKNLKNGGIIISDNVLYKGMIANDELVVRRQKTIVRKMREYLEYICNNEFLESSIIPIGDGVALSYKRRYNK